MAWYAWDRDWAGPIRIEVDRARADGWPRYPNIPRTHTARMHVRLACPQSPSVTDADVERVTAAIVAAAGPDALLVAQTRRPDRARGPRRGCAPGREGRSRPTAPRRGSRGRTAHDSG